MISPALKVEIFFRSFFIQAAWNVERMQNVGFLFSIRRALKNIWKDDPAGFEAATLRASSFFNTHPYFAPALMGVALHIEEKISKGLASPERVESAKTRLSSPLNALGSLWFWDHLKLLGFLVALPLLVLRSPVAIASGAAFFFLFFNYYHIRTRWVGLGLGLRLGEEMIPNLLSMFPSRWLQSCRRISTFIIGIVTPLILAVLFERLGNRLPNLADAFYIPDFFVPRLLLAMALTGAMMLVMYFRWLSVYVLISLSLVIAVGVARWG